ncbi:MAG TPA: DNA-processing protein DprA [Gemmatimonadaceae bacterium]|nr:DNA-processing protein DprA [Gemmatimonadaceae bacterium]
MGDGATGQRDAIDALTLLALPRVGLREWHRRVADAGSAGAALARMPHAERELAAREAQTVVEHAVASGYTLLVHGTVGYPAALYDLTHCDERAVTPAPPVLFAEGDCALLDRPTVALVGTRHATAAGLRAGERIARTCAEAGALVISGLARGVDAAAHTGALDGSGNTAAVIGTGIDVAYPADHRSLQRRIARDGLLLTELPPGQRATRGSFPERNRLIAALAQVTVVVEAGHRSGALLTARIAESLNRGVAAVPGTFDAAASLGSNELLRDGAHVIATVDDVLALLRLARADDRHAIAPPQLTEAERAIWDVLGSAPLDLDVVVERAGWAADACLAAVTTLELKGLVQATHAGALQRT